MIKTHRSSWWAAFAVLMTLQFIKALLVFGFLPLGQLGGDEPYYMEKGRAIWVTGRLPVRADRPLAEKTDMVRWNVDFRPPGYPLFLAAIHLFGGETKAVQASAWAAHSLMDTVGLCIVLFVFCWICSHWLWRLVAAVVLGVQPWTSAFVAVLTPDTTTAFLTVLGIFCLARSHRLETHWGVFCAMGGSLVLSATFLLRPEYIVMVPPVVACSLLLKHLSLKRFVISACLLALPFLFCVGMNVAYRYHFDGTFGIFGEHQHRTPGLLRWSHTWMGSESIKKAVLFRSPVNKLNPDRIPARAFADTEEKEEIYQLFGKIRNQGHMTQSVDAEFGRIADRRIARHRIYYYVWLRLISAAHYHVNLETSQYLLHGFASLPRLLSRMLVVMFFLLKVVILLAAGVVWCLLVPKISKATYWAYEFVMVGMSFLLLRIFILAFSGIELVMHRLAVCTWPFILQAGLLALGGSWKYVSSKTTPYGS